MNRLFRLSVLLGASLFFTGCSTADKRIDNIEAQMQNVQVLDIRLANAEERLTKVEGDIVSMKEAPAAKTKGGKKNAKAADDKRYALPASAPAARTTAAAPQPVPVSARPAPQPIAAAPQPRPAPILGVPQPYESVYTDGRKVEPRPAAPAPAPVAASAGRSGKKPAPAMTPVSMATASPAAKPAPAKPAVTSPAAPKTGTNSYDAALALYYKGQYAKAQEGFSSFLRESPSSKLAPNAMYWQGECQYSQGRFDKAIMTFKDLAGKYPKHPKAAAALLKAGYAYAQLKDMENARFYWQILIDDFPKSQPATMARKRMAQG